MKKLIFLILILPLVAACDGMARKKSFTSDTCVDGGGDPAEMKGYTRTAIAYGDSYLVVIPISEVRPETEFRFHLAPKRFDNENIDYESATVSITSDDDDGDTPADWLDVEGTFSVNGTLVACVPDIAPDQTYKYKVTISTTNGGTTTVHGFLDPRADIIPWLQSF